MAGVNIKLEDGKGTSKEVHLHERDEDVGVVAFTRPLRVGKIKLTPVFNPTEGIEMARNGAFGGTPEEVHDGTDTAAWTGSNIVGGKAVFNSTDQANSGTKSVKVDNPLVDDIWQFAKGSDLTISSYTAITLFIYIDKDWNTGESVGIYGWDTGTAMQVGNQVLLEDYINELDFDIWQKAIIPLADMGLTSGTLDALRIKMLVTVDGKNPKMYFDDIQFEETGSAITYKIEAEEGKRLLIDRLHWTIIDVLDTTLLNATMPNLSYDKLLDETLVNGVNLQWIVDGKVQFSSVFKTISEATQGAAEITNMMCDGTNTALTIIIRFPEPVLLDSFTQDSISVTISDDLTGLISLKMMSIGREEDIKQGTDQDN